MIAEDLLKILVCPESKQPLREADRTILELVNAHIGSGSLRNRDGQPVTEPLQEALVTQDGAVLYPVRDGIPVMLVGESISLEADQEA